jgi:hypothetical protein
LRYYDSLGKPGEPRACSMKKASYGLGDTWHNDGAVIGRAPRHGPHVMPGSPHSYRKVTSETTIMMLISNHTALHPTWQLPTGRPRRRSCGLMQLAVLLSQFPTRDIRITLRGTCSVEYKAQAATILQQHIESLLPRPLSSHPFHFT